MTRRLRMTMAQYRELDEARRWCAANGLEGFRQYYDEELGFQAYRRALPAEVMREMPSDDDDDRRGRRDRDR